MSAYYNEIDPKAAAWLRELIRQRLIADGEVDERSIVDVQSDDLRGFDQCHFFAGIGGWSYALRLAGWPDERAVWTGSCPCQPWSLAGKGQGADDPRDLWPAWRALITERRPPTVFGEQVAGKDGSYWLDRVFGDLEAEAFAVAAADLCSPGVGAPHLRQRIYFVADAAPLRARELPIRPGRQVEAPSDADRDGEGVGLGMADTDGGHGFWWSGPLQVGWNAIKGEVERGGRKYRAQWRIEPGLPLLAYGIPGRVALIGGFGNAIVPQLAAEVIAAYMEIA